MKSAPRQVGSLVLALDLDTRHNGHLVRFYEAYLTMYVTDRHSQSDLHSAGQIGVDKFRFGNLMTWLQRQFGTVLLQSAGTSFFLQQ